MGVDGRVTAAPIPPGPQVNGPLLVLDFEVLLILLPTADPIPHIPISDTSIPLRLPPLLFPEGGECGGAAVESAEEVEQRPQALAVDEGGDEGVGLRGEGGLEALRVLLPALLLVVVRRARQGRVLQEFVYVRLWTLNGRLQGYQDRI